MKRGEYPTLTDTAAAGRVFTCVCGNRALLLPPRVQVHHTWALECPTCRRMYALLPEGEIVQYLRSQSEYAQPAESWELSEHFKTALLADLTNPTEARIDAVLAWAHRTIFGTVSQGDIADGGLAMGEALIDAIMDGKISLVDFCDGEPVFVGRQGLHPEDDKGKEN